LALGSFDLALVNRAGYVSDLSLMALGLTFGLLLISRSLPSGPPPTWLWVGVIGALGLSLLLANFTAWPEGWPVWIYVVAAIAAAVLVARGHNRAALMVAALGALVFLAVCWRWDPSRIDVLYGLRSAGHALLAGGNPYLSLHLSTTLGAPRLIHFTYGPMVAIVAAIGLLFGDPRVMQALAVLAFAGALFRLSQSRIQGWRLALTVAITPVIIAVVISSWPIMLAIAGIAWWLVLRASHRRVAVFLLGLALGCALVQVGPLLLVLFLRSRRMMREMLVAAAIAVVIVGSFAWWTGFAHYWYDTIGIHFHGQVGVGSLSLAGILTLIGKHPLPGFLGIAVGALVLAWVISRPTPGLGGLLTDAAVVSIFAMFFAKFAYINYYFPAMAAIWLAIAAGGSSIDPEQEQEATSTASRSGSRAPGKAPAQAVVEGLLAAAEAS
jgi:hypothetical protein